ncbi:MAG: tRNA (cytidine(34)-2'-O)-methyltransferase [Clostridiales bacterium]|nr:tRNA (cytidine(34)-2'-O)-methyltransferase [Clostridiales bacterium]
MAVEIVLYQPEIPPNTGNIARTCALTGTKLHLIKPLGFSIDSKAVKRAGLDYWHLLDLEVHDSLDDFLVKYGDKKIYLSTTKATKNYSEVDFSEDCLIIFGKETAGLPSSLHENYDKNRFIIPMLVHEDVRSLNLSNSVAIVLYEALRQQNFKQLL